MAPAAPVAPRPPALDDDGDDDALDVDESPLRDGRNENSLAFLCQRFCEMYQNHSEPINIDHAAKELGIQRRRMYEILNIIQSVGLVGRLRASFYRWDGYDKMAVVLERLKEEGLARLASASRAAAASTPEGQRRKAVATALGERFVQIFLCNEVPQPVILEDIMGLFAACVGPSGTGAAALTNQTSCARRLYDIANVFCSIGLVRKSCAPATDNRRKKRLYDWIGPVPTATTTPLRPQRLTLAAPTASPGSGSAKRVKRESAAGLDTPKTTQLRKKSRLSNVDLEASIRKADEEGDALDAKAHKVLQHPAVVALRGAGLVSGAPPPNGAGVKRSMLIARKLEPPSGARALGALASSASKASLFNPPNAKDSSLSTFSAPSGGKKLPPAPSLSSTSSSASSSVSSSVSSSHAATCTCSCSSSSPKAAGEAALLRAQIEELKKELQDAKTREVELRLRIDIQEEQLQTLKSLQAKGTASKSATPNSATFLLNAGSSPLTSLVFSPFQGSLARDAFSSLTGSPSPFHNGNFFSPASRSGKPPFTRRAARVGPHLVDPAESDDLLPLASPHLSPGTTSIASSLLLSPAGPTSDKENRLVDQQILSPPRVTTIKSEAAPSTPPCNLIATAASSLLSLTPSQLPSFSPSINRIFANDPTGSDTEDEELSQDNQTEALSEQISNQDDVTEDAARMNAASPEPQAVRTPASLPAPSSPSPSAKGAKSLLARHPHHAKSPAVSSPLVKPRINECIAHAQET